MNGNELFKQPTGDEAAHLTCLSAAAETYGVFCLWCEGVFVALGLSGVIPAGHFVITDGISHAFNYAALGWVILMAFLYIIGAVVYAARVPERIWPGRFDIWVGRLLNIWESLRWPRPVESIMQWSGIRPSVCLIGILTMTHQGAACDAASLHFGPTERKTDIPV